MTIKITSKGGIPTRVSDVKAVRQAALVAHAVTTARAFDRGHGLDDRPHAPYSPDYARWRASKGRRVSPPDLTVTGRMRRSYRVIKVRRDRATLGLTGDPAIYGAFVNAVRRFIGASPNDRALIRKKLPEIFAAAIRRSIRP